MAPNRRLSLKVASLIFFGSQMSQAFAACLETGTGEFVDQESVVQLCLGTNCQHARSSRICGNIHYSAFEFSTVNFVWNFRVQHSGEPNAKADLFDVLRRPIDLNEIPFERVDGRLVKIIKGSKVDASILRALKCIAISAPTACDEINHVLAKGSAALSAK